MLKSLKNFNYCNRLFCRFSIQKTTNPHGHYLNRSISKNKRWNKIDTGGFGHVKRRKECILKYSYIITIEHTGKNLLVISCKTKTSNDSCIEIQSMPLSIKLVLSLFTE